MNSRIKTGKVISAQVRAFFDDNAIAILGFGLFWAWVWVLEKSSALNPFAAEELSSSLPFGAIGHASSAACMLLGALLSKRLPSKNGRLVLVAGALAFAVAASILRVAGIVSAEHDLALLGSIPAGISRACFNFLWGAFFGSQSFRRGTAFMAASVALGALVFCIATLLLPIPAMALAIILPFFAAGFCARSIKPKGAAETRPSDAEPFPFRSFARLYAGILIYSVSFSFVMQSFFPIANENFALIAQLSYLAIVLVGSAITVAAICFSRDPAILTGSRLILPVTAIGCLLVPLLEGDMRSVSSGFMLVGFTIFDVMTWLALANGSKRLELSPYRVFGFGRSVHFFGMCIGSALAFRLTHVGGGIPEAVVPVTLALLFALIIASTLILTEETLLKNGYLTTGEDLSGEAVEQNPSSENNQQAKSPWKTRCLSIAEEHKLTPRETEVFLLLAKGRNTEYIQNHLGISSHTARSHVYHIYQKLNAHSRQELISLIEHTEHDLDESRQSSRIRSSSNDG